MTGDIWTVTVPNSISSSNTIWTNQLSCGCWGYCSGTHSIYYYTWPQKEYIYLYQVKCPKKSCGKMNFLELNKVTPCKGCSAKLKAVSEEADYEIPVEK